MKYLSFIIPSGKRIQFVISVDDVTDNADYYIYYEDRVKILDTIKLLVSKFKADRVTKGIAKELIGRKLLWKN